MVYKRRRPIGGKVEVKYLHKLLNESYKGKNKTAANIDDRYILDNDLSTDKTKVYIDKNTNDIAMVNRGTSDFKDVMTDAKLLFGYNDKRFNEPKEILNKVKQKYTDNAQGRADSFDPSSLVMKKVHWPAVGISTKPLKTAAKF